MNNKTLWSEQYHVDGICGTLIVNLSGSSRVNVARSKIDPLIPFFSHIEVEQRRSDNNCQSANLGGHSARSHTDIAAEATVADASGAPGKSKQQRLVSFRQPREKVAN